MAPQGDMALPGPSFSARVRLCGLSSVSAPSMALQTLKQTETRERPHPRKQAPTPNHVSSTSTWALFQDSGRQGSVSLSRPSEPGTGALWPLSFCSEDSRLPCPWPPWCQKPPLAGRPAVGQAAWSTLPVRRGETLVGLCPETGHSRSLGEDAAPWPAP